MQCGKWNGKQIWALRYLLVGVLVLWCSSIGAQSTNDWGSTLSAAEQQVDRITKDVAQIQRSLEDADSVDTLAHLATESLQAQRSAQTLVEQLTPELGRLNARLELLGPALEGESEDSVLKAQRETVLNLRNGVDATIRQSNVQAVEAGQLAERIEALRVRQFNAHMFERQSTPLSFGFWRELANQWPEDWQRVSILLRQGHDAWLQAWRDSNQRGNFFLAALALLLIVPLRRWLRAIGIRLAASEHLPQGRFRRSALAVWLLLTQTLVPSIAVWIAIECLRAASAITPRLELVANQVIIATAIAAFLAVLSASILMPQQPSWRLIKLSDDTIAHLRKYTWGAAVVVWVSVLVRTLNTSARTSEVATAAVDGLFALVYMALIAAVLRTLTKRRQASEGLAVRSGLTFLALIGGHFTLLAAFIGAVLGYLNFSMFAASQMVWMTAVVMTSMLLLKFVDDACGFFFSSDGRVGRIVMLAFGQRNARLEQIGVLFSAALRLGVLFLTVVMIAAPYGNSAALYSGVDLFSNGITIGGAELKPWALIRALLVFLVCLSLFRFLQNWLENTFLPKTELDVGARNSIKTMVRYAGITFSFLWALAALGIGFEKIALLASALSVGIGFGLQAITQNFVSGLILLAERPVKLGDRVRIGDQEGDIRRINVRATEIQVDDRSTLIVPNSELITKSVRNLTMGSPIGRLQLRFGVPLSTDVTVLRELMQAVFAENEAVLKTPAPNVYIDSIEAGMIIINSNAHVSSPRAAYRTRSDLLFALLPRLGQAGIPLMTPADIHLVKDKDEPADKTSDSDSA